MRGSALMTVAGFSLIELMIVIAIMGILASVAIPAYGDYMIRSRVGSMVASGALIQNAVSEYRIENGNLTTGIIPSSSSQTFTNIGTTDPTLATSLNTNVTTLNASISSIQFALLNDNSMAIVLCGSMAGQGTNTTGDTVDIYLTGGFTTGGMAWGCEYVGKSTYVPSSCRTAYQPTIYGTPAVACVH